MTSSIKTILVTPLTLILLVSNAFAENETKIKVYGWKTSPCKIKVYDRNANRKNLNENCASPLPVDPKKESEMMAINPANNLVDIGNDRWVKSTDLKVNFCDKAVKAEPPSTVANNDTSGAMGSGKGCK